MSSPPSRETRLLDEIAEHTRQLNESTDEKQKDYLRKTLVLLREAQLEKEQAQREKERQEREKELLILQASLMRPSSDDIPIVIPDTIRDEVNKLVSSISEYDKKLCEMDIHSIIEFKIEDDGENAQTIDIPFVTTNQWNKDRFRVEKGDPYDRLRVILRPMMSKLLSDFKAFCFDVSKSGIYVHGPQGIGKSHALFALVCALRTKRRIPMQVSSRPGAGPRSDVPVTIRVTYIQDCMSWIESHIRDPYVFLVRELVATFYDDTELNILELAARLLAARPTEHARLSIFQECLGRCHEYVRRKGLRWINVFDQVNAIYARKLENTYPFTICVQRTAPDEATFTIASGSANNEGYEPQKLANYHKIKETHVSYTNAEFIERIKMANPELIKDDFLKDMEQVTGRNPLEVERLLVTLASDSDASASTLSRKRKVLDTFEQSRHSEISDAHSKFRRQLPSDYVDVLNRCIFHMLIKAPLLPSLHTNAIDQQQMLVTHDPETGLRYVDPLTPLSRTALRQFIPINEIHHITQVTTEFIFTSPSHTNDVKGRTVEKYVIETMRVEKTAKFQLTQFMALLHNRTNHGSPIEFRIESSVEIHSGRIPRRAFDASRTTLFSPTSSNYEDIDLLLFHAPTKCLYAMQITIHTPVSKHVDKCKFFKRRKKRAKSLANEWAHYCGIDKSNVYLIWLVDDASHKNVGSLPSDKHSVIEFSEVYRQFPALKNLRKNEKDESDKLEEEEDEDNDEDDDK